MKAHSLKVQQLQQKMQELLKQRRSQAPIALKYHSNASNTVRSKSYKKSKDSLDFGTLNQVIQIDPEKRTALVEPRVAMKDLMRATLKYGLTAPVIPEFKGITVGGAIMGGSAESSSHRWGSFNDSCTAFEILCGDGTLLRVAPDENPDLFYGLSCSYGSLGGLVLAEIQLVPAKEFVHLRYHFFSNPQEAIQRIQKLMHAPDAPDFIDGIIFAKDNAVVIEGTLQSTATLPIFSLKPLYAEWYFQHVKKKALESPNYEEVMPFSDYLFRYDQGAFWMGAYLFRPQILARFIGQGILKLYHTSFSKDEIGKLHTVPSPNMLLRTLTHPFMTSQNLWKLHHLAQQWVQDRVIIQDFCIPEAKAADFVAEVVEDPGTFPLWLCPIKGTTTPQIFAPHLLSENQEGHFINIGIYGLPSHDASIEQITKTLEHKTKAYGGRKVLYSRSFYTEEEFWQIYSREAYNTLRTKTGAQEVWHEITEKVLR